MIVMVCSSIAASGPMQDDKKKEYEKTFQCNDETILNIENKFGLVEINTWDKKEIYVKVEIIAETRSTSRADRLLDDIEVAFSESNSNIFCETKIANNKNGNNESFEINYTIYMPETNPLNIRNSFGDVSMGNRKADLKLDVSYGSFRVGEVSGYADIKLSFGKGSSISKIEKGEITVKYSDLEMEEAHALELNCGFSDIEIGKVEALELQAKYGDIKIEEAIEIVAEVQFSGFVIDRLEGKLIMEANYVGNFTIGRLSQNFTLLDIEGKFGSYEIGLEPGLNADIEAEFSFADLNVSSDLDVAFNYKIKETNKSYYKGKIGKGHPDKKIKIDSGYGGARITID